MRLLWSRNLASRGSVTHATILRTPPRAASTAPILAWPIPISAPAPASFAFTIRTQRITPSSAVSASRAPLGLEFLRHIVTLSHSPFPHRPVPREQRLARSPRLFRCPSDSLPAAERPFAASPSIRRVRATPLLAF